MHCAANPHRNPARVRTMIARSIRGWTVAALFGTAVLGPASAILGFLARSIAIQTTETEMAPRGCAQRATPGAMKTWHAN
jgi:hypothetical protein